MDVFTQITMDQLMRQRLNTIFGPREMDHALQALFERQKSTVQIVRSVLEAVRDQERGQFDA